MELSEPGIDSSPALHNDLYQLTMAYGYWRSEVAEREAQFHLFFRRNPFGGGFSVACGVETALQWLQRFRFHKGELDYLRAIKGHNGQRVFPDDFLAYLRMLRLKCHVEAVPEGTPVFPNEPIVTVQGPLVHCQLVETGLLNIINFQTLIATKAARIRQAAEPCQVIEFGLRRAQGPDGGLMASRAAFIGGCDSTSNVLAGYKYQIPVQGTHAHSWVQVFGSEERAFEAYADALPANCIFLVDTYDTHRGIQKAIEVGLRLNQRRGDLLGVRLDSGNLLELSRTARSMLDAAGLKGALIVASGDLDEFRIAELRQQGAPIDTWGVGTRLATGWPDGALTGVYKLSALQNSSGVWVDRLKLSEERAKASLPGLLRLRRFRRDGQMCFDLVYDSRDRLDDGSPWVDPVRPDATHSTRDYEGSDILKTVFSNGQAVEEFSDLAQVRQRCLDEVALLPEGVLRLTQTERYPVGVEQRLWVRRGKMENRFRRRTEQ